MLKLCNLTANTRLDRCNGLSYPGYFEPLGYDLF